MSRPRRGGRATLAAARSAALAAALGLAAAAIPGCTPGEDERPPGGPAAPAPAAAAAPFTDVTEAAGIRFVHANGASARRYLPETMGSGVAFFDYDGDGRPDLYFANSMPVDTSPAGEPQSGEPPSGERPSGALYRNLGPDATGEVRFEDVTRRAGLAEPFLGMGVAVGDLDNDGDLDLFVSGVGGDRLFVNGGDGAFREAAAERGLVDRGFGSSAAFLDYDNDGWLDLFVGRYVEWSPEADVRCSPDGRLRIYCTPEVYPAVASRLYRNLGGGRFEDATAASGIGGHPGKTLGVVPIDHDDDGWPDLAVANDTAPDFLFLNQRDGTFREIGLATGMAVSESGAPRGGMGIDAGDLDGDGAEELVIGNFSQEMAGLYRASGGVYTDVAAQAGIGLPTLMTLAFGTLVFDHDGDGGLDVAFANGHIEPEIARFHRLQSYAQPIQLFWNRDRGERFEQAAPAEGAAAGWWGPWVARGLAAGDYDGDGDLDLVVTQNGGPARLLRNDAPPATWLRVRLAGRASNRSGYGALVTAVAGERRVSRRLVSGRSYLSASEPVVTFGLGDAARIDRVEVRWPSGAVQTVDSPPAGGVLDLEEPAAAGSGAR